MFKFFSSLDKKSPSSNPDTTSREVLSGVKEKIAENYGMPEIDNPQILRLISAIDLNYWSSEKIDAFMDRIIRDNASSENYGTLAHVLTEREKDRASGAEIRQQTLYGYQGMNRYGVGSDGRVSLLMGSNIRPDQGSMKKAQELGVTLE